MGRYEKGIWAKSRGNDMMVPVGSSVMICLVFAQNLHENRERSGTRQADENFIIGWGGEGEGFTQLLNFMFIFNFSD